MSAILRDRFVVMTTYHFPESDRKLFVGESKYAEIIDTSQLKEAKFHSSKESAYATAERSAKSMDSAGVSATLQVMRVHVEYWDMQVTVNK